MDVILDSSTVIAAERRGDSPRVFVHQVIASSKDQSAALSAVGLTEIVHGIYRANSMERRLRRQQFLDELLTGLAVHPYTSYVTDGTPGRKNRRRATGAWHRDSLLRSSDRCDSAFAWLCCSNHKHTPLPPHSRLDGSLCLISLSRTLPSTDKAYGTVSGRKACASSVWKRPVGPATVEGCERKR